MKVKITVGIIVLLYVIASMNSARFGGDFDVYLDAAQKLENGQNIYGPPYLRSLQYFYSPLFALMLIPFTRSFFTVELIWLLVSGFLLFRTIRLLIRYFDLSLLSRRQMCFWGILTSFFMLRFLLYNVSMIQITVFLLWAIFESIELINSRKLWLGSFVLALAINIKLLPLVILPYLIYRLKLKSVFAVVGFVLLLIFLPSLFLGHDYNMFLVSEWWGVINPLQCEYLIESDINSQSLVGMIPVFLTETQGGLEVKRNFLSISQESAIAIMNVLRLSLVVLTLFFLKSPFSNRASKLSNIRALSYICLLIPLIFPHQQKYAVLFLLPMAMYLTYYCLVRWKYNRSNKFKIYIGLLLIVALPLTPIVGAEIIGWSTYELIHHFRITGISTVLIIVFGAIAKPESLKVGSEKKSQVG